MRNFKSFKIKNINPALKIAFVIFINLVIAFAPERVRSLLLNVLITGVIVKGTKTLNILKKVKGMFFFIGFCTMLIWGISYPYKHDLLFFSGLGIMYGLYISIKLLSIMSISLAYVYSTSSDEIVEGLISLKIPYRVAYVFSDALLFVPIIVERYHVASGVLRLSKENDKNEKFYEKMKSFGKQIFVVICSAIKDMDMHALALELKGFGYVKSPTVMFRQRWGQKDIVCGIIMSVIFFIYYY